VTWYYAHLVKQQVKQEGAAFDRQAAEARAIGLKQIRRAVHAIIVELRIDATRKPAEFEECCPLLAQAYGANLWALAEGGLASNTVDALARAYMGILKYNALYKIANTSAAYSNKRNRALQAHQQAQTYIQKAIERLGDDNAVAQLVGPQAFASEPPVGEGRSDA
jgi:hypothetical protein